MKIVLDDPILTDYAIDELGTTERAAVEKILQDSPALRARVDEIRGAAEMLRGGFAAEPVPQWPLEFKTDGAPRQRSRGRRIAVLALAASIILAAGLGGLYLLESAPQTEAFARMADQISHAKSIAWTRTSYLRETGADGKSWLTTETRQLAFKSPGLYRETEAADGTGGLRYVTITDAINNRELDINPKTRTATLSEVAVPSWNADGPWVDDLAQLKSNDLQWVESRKSPAGDVNVFRRALVGSDGKPLSYDFWIDMKTRRLVELHIPGVDIFDPDTDPDRDNPPGKWREKTCAGTIEHDIVYDAALDDSLFSLQPPAGYALVRKARPTVTEQEMIDYLRIMAECNGGMFPDDAAISIQRKNAIWGKAGKDRTAAEQKLLDTDQHYIQAGLYYLPVGQYIADSAVAGSFRYLGKGVKFGDAGRIVCWYRQNGLSTYRVVYGDLSIKDVLPDALPLPVQP